VVAHLHRMLRWRPEDPLAAKLRMLEETLVAYGFTLPEVVPLLAVLLALPLPERYPPLTLAPQRQREKTLEALLAWLLAEANRQPVLFIVEDLHWSDPSTLEFLTLLLDRGPAARLLTLLTCRPGFTVPWGFRAHLTALTLNRLPQPQVAQMIVHVAGGKALPPEVVAQIVAKTDGVPLFVEELTRTVLESGWLQERQEGYELTGPLPPLAIPATLHDSLMARLDRLTTVKAVAQLGATIGRTFAYDLLEAVAPLDAATLQQGLRQLVETELVYQRGVPPQATYTFKHALIQDAAYHSLLHSTRRQYHQCIAQVLEAQFPDLERASAHLEQGIALYHPQQHRTHVLLYGGHDPGVCCQSFAAYAAWVRGYPDQALRWGHAVLTLAQELLHPFSLTLSLQQVAVLDQFFRRKHAVQERAEACMTLAADQGFSEWLAIGTILRGWALAMQSQEAEGMAQIRQGLGALGAKGGEVQRPYWLALLAEAYGTVGQHKAGCSVLAEALAVVDKTDERFYEAELYRLKGELTLQAEGHSLRPGVVTPFSTIPQPYVEEAEICFQQSLAIARRQQAKAWELRAAMSLAQLWQCQGKRAEAYELLAPVHGWFTEGFDTADLQEAKVLLEALAE
jgi:predicted ATPase